MQLVEKPFVQIQLKKKGGYILLSPLNQFAGALDEFRLTPYHTLQASTIKGTPVVESTQVPMATSTVERTKGQIGLEKLNNVVVGKEPEQQVEDEQWEFIRYEVEKMKEVEKLFKKNNKSSK